MRWLGVLGVFAYRLFVRPFLRRRCLYDESCSAFAIRVLREHGMRRAVPQIRARVRSCRMPAAACFVIGADGRAHLLSATSHDGGALPPQALLVVAADAERVARDHQQLGTL